MLLRRSIQRRKIGVVHSRSDAACWLERPASGLSRHSPRAYARLARMLWFAFLLVGYSWLFLHPRPLPFAYRRCGRVLPSDADVAKFVIESLLLAPTVFTVTTREVLTVLLFSGIGSVFPFARVKKPRGSANVSKRECVVGRRSKEPPFEACDPSFAVHIIPLLPVLRAAAWRLTPLDKVP